MPLENSETMESAKQEILDTLRADDARPALEALSPAELDTFFNAARSEEALPPELQLPAETNWGELFVSCRSFLLGVWPEGLACRGNYSTDCLKAAANAAVEQLSREAKNRQNREWGQQPPAEQRIRAPEQAPPNQGQVPARERIRAPEQARPNQGQVPARERIRAPDQAPPNQGQVPARERIRAPDQARPNQRQAPAQQEIRPPNQSQPSSNESRLRLYSGFREDPVGFLNALSRYISTGLRTIILDWIKEYRLALIDWLWSWIEPIVMGLARRLFEVEAQGPPVPDLEANQAQTQQQGLPQPARRIDTHNEEGLADQAVPVARPPAPRVAVAAVR